MTSPRPFNNTTLRLIQSGRTEDPFTNKFRELQYCAYNFIFVKGLYESTSVYFAEIFQN
jgi:hypothetical protein